METMLTLIAAIVLLGISCVLASFWAGTLLLVHVLQRLGL